MEEIIIRKMQLGDHVSIQKNLFTLTSLEQVEETVKSNVKQMQEQDSWTYFVAEYENEVVATMYLEKFENRLNKHMGEICTVVTAEQFQNKGICKKMFYFLVDYAKTRQIEKLLISVRKGSIAEMVYKKLGFTQYGELPKGIKEDGKYIDKVLFYYDLV